MLYCLFTFKFKAIENESDGEIKSEAGDNDKILSELDEGELVSYFTIILILSHDVSLLIIKMKQ